MARAARLLASAAIVAVLALSAAGCKTTSIEVPVRGRSATIS
jgi:hypothetical protein